MIDPYFQKRLWNWSRAIRSRYDFGSKMLSPTAQAIDALALQYDTPAQEQGSDMPAPDEKSLAVDLIDADRLSRAYASKHLSNKARDLLRLKYGECRSDATCARRLCMGERLFREIHEAVCKKFQGIVETYFDPK